MSSAAKKWLVACGAALAVIAIIILAAVWVVRAPFPRTRGAISAPGLGTDVEVLRDRFGVPHIRASSMHDLYFAEGYVTAQDRFWQMDFWRRIGQGRLSEYFGKATLGTDMYLRTVGFRRIADEEYRQMDGEAKAAFDSYAEGVNAYLKGKQPRSLSLEYTLLQLQGVKVNIEPWVVRDSITWLKLMAQDLGSNMRREMYSVDLIQRMGLARTTDFFGPYRYSEMPVIVSDSELLPELLGPKKKLSGVADLAPQVREAMAGLGGRVLGPGGPLVLGSLADLGSNNWVISGSRTASAKPLLANDPHLGIQMPSIWYEVDLDCSAPEAQPGKNAGGPYHVHGFTFAGVPGIVIGHNDRIAWGVTNLYPDTQDLFIEKVNPENPNQYEVNGKWVDMSLREESISVLHQDEPTRILVRQTRHGPVITDPGGFSGYRAFTMNPGGVFPGNLELHVLSLKWTALQPNRTFESVVELDRARNFQEFRDALRSWDVPAQNFVYADIDGNIGYQAPGLVPIRSRGTGVVPSPGWTDEYEWKGFVPFDSLPSSFNPPKGYIVSANNPVTSPSYRYFLGEDFDLGYRARRISEMIEGARSPLTVRDVQDMQADTLNVSAREVMPYLKPLTLEGDAAKGRDLLLAWDLRMDPRSAGAAVYAFFWQALLKETFKERIPQALWSEDAVLERFSRLMNDVIEMLSDPVAPFWDDPISLGVHETRDQVLTKALQKGMAAGIRKLGSDVAHWKWGAVHTAVFRNQTFGRSGIPLVERIFNRGPVPVGGGMQQVASSDWSPDRPFEVTLISSMRQIIDLSNLGSSETMNATGQSGHVGDRHYADMIPSWASVRYHPTGWDETALGKSDVERLVLRAR